MYICIYTYLSPLFVEFPYQLGHPRPLRKIPCALQEVFISYSFYIKKQKEKRSTEDEMVGWHH